MSISALMPTLDAVGYAKVIVSLRASAAPPRATAMALATSHAPVIDAAAFMSLQNHFVLPPSTRHTAPAAAAALALATGSRRRVARAGAASISTPPAAPRMRVFPRLGLALGFVDKIGAAALVADPRVSGLVKAPELSLIRPVASTPAQPPTQLGWGLLRLGADRLWTAGFHGQGVVVGHLDTGVDGTHPALQGAIKSFAQFDDVGELVPGAAAFDSGEHGTHTAGTIAARATDHGSNGMAPECKLVCGMVIEGGQVIDRILSGLEWVVGEKCKVLSMSLGLPGMTPAFQVVIDAVRAAGVLPVIAIGNEKADTSRSPGNYANVLSVGAIDGQDQVAEFSGSQRFDRADNPLVPLLVAPGVEVLSCVPNGGYATMDGTSMATPHVAGLAALLFSAKPNATIDEIENAILTSCIRPTAMPEGRGNHGVPDGGRAFEALTGTPLPAPVAAATTTGRTRRRAAATKPPTAKAASVRSTKPRTRTAGRTAASKTTT